MAVRKEHAQAYVELRTEDPEATSALAVARDRLSAGRDLVGLRRFRLFEIAGAAIDHATLALRLHGSTQFYNPVRERCVVRTDSSEPVPAGDDEALVLVFERDGERRAAAERWWRHDGGQRVEIREGVVWALRFAPGTDATARAGELAVTEGRARGLFANVNAEEYRVCAGSVPPLDWMTHRVPRSPRRGRRSP